MQSEDIVAPPVGIRKGVRAVWRLLKPFKKYILIMVALGIVSAMANGLVPYVTGQFFDALIKVAQGTPQGLLPLWAVMLAAWFFVQLVANSTDWILDRVRRGADIKAHLTIQAEGFVHLFHLPISFHKNEQINGVIEKINKASWQVPASLSTLANFGPQMLSVLIGLLLVLSINTAMAGILAIGVAVYLLLLIWILHPVAQLHDQALRTWNEGWNDAASAAHQIESVKHAAAEEYESEKVRTTLADHAFNMWYRLQKIWSNVSFYQRGIVFLTQFGVFLFSVQLIADGNITVGQLVALNGYALMFFGPFVALGQEWETVQNGLASASHLEDILDATEEPYHPENGVTLGVARGAVAFENVSFQYTTQQGGTLRDVSFTVEPGEVVAFVGESGVGKSTAISLISGYHLPTTGVVKIDGIDVRTLHLISLRQHIAVVPQEIALFNDTIGNNIRYGMFDASEVDVHRAAEQAHIADFVEGLPLKYKTVVGERGMKLSVGQKQRIAIARAILRDPAILILDEPTSALDAKTEHDISKSLATLMENRTTFIIAHRLSTVRKADKILVFEKGRIAEVGTHQELVEKEDGVYRKLYEYQIGLHE